LETEVCVRQAAEILSGVPELVAGAGAELVDADFTASFE
jgi:hypothetical protein